VKTLAIQIDALLPQTQCTKCGYAGCMPYAEAISNEDAPINRCPPGGNRGIAALAALLGRASLRLDPSCGLHLPHRIAVIDEAACIGCAKCLPPCPTDAIIGTSKFMHSVAPALCTGCELCIAPCPVDCITMIESAAFPAMMDAGDARIRYQQHLERLARAESERNAMLAERERAVLVQENRKEQPING
jgi:electron transport complex protein RnfB